MRGVERTPKLAGIYFPCVFDPWLSWQTDDEKSSLALTHGQIDTPINTYTPTHTIHPRCCIRGQHVDTEFASKRNNFSREILFHLPPQTNKHTQTHAKSQKTPLVLVEEKKITPKNKHFIIHLGWVANKKSFDAIPRKRRLVFLNSI